MEDEVKLSEQAKKLEEALRTDPPQYNIADEFFHKGFIAPEEIAKIAYDLIDECSFEELYFNIDNLDKFEENATMCSNIYKVMQYLFSKGYNPNLIVNDYECAMACIPDITYPDGLAPRLMRLFMENGGDPNIVRYPNLKRYRDSIFECIHNAVTKDKYLSRSYVYCWLVMMAYGGRLRSYEENYLPITMYNDLDVSIFKHFEDYAFYEVIPYEPPLNQPPFWKMLIYETMQCINEKFLVASYIYENEIPTDTDFYMLMNEPL